MIPILLSIAPRRLSGVEDAIAASDESGTGSALVTIGLVRAIGFGVAELVFVHLLPKHDNGRLA
jgi:hypothetical protein